MPSNAARIANWIPESTPVATSITDQSAPVTGIAVHPRRGNRPATSPNRDQGWDHCDQDTPGATPIGSAPGSGRIAQLARALPLQGRSRGFESLCAHHHLPGITRRTRPQSDQQPGSVGQLVGQLHIHTGIYSRACDQGPAHRRGTHEDPGRAGTWQISRCLQPVVLRFACIADHSANLS